MKATYEQIKAQEAEFRARHLDWQHSYVQTRPSGRARVMTIWDALLQRQNGRDVDDAVIDEEHRIVAYLKTYAPVDRFARLLIVGAGVGREVIVAREMGYATEGITLGPMNVAFAREMLGVNLHIIDAHSASEVFGCASFDAIVALQTLEHSWAPLMLLIEFARMLRPGGKVIIETPPSADWTCGRDLHHAICPTPRQLEGLLIKAGFLDVALKCITGFEAAPDTDLDCALHHVLASGTRWTLNRSEDVEPTIRELTGGR